MNKEETKIYNEEQEDMRLISKAVRIYCCHIPDIWIKTEREKLIKRRFK